MILQVVNSQIKSNIPATRNIKNWAESGEYERISNK